MIKQSKQQSLEEEKERAPSDREAPPLKPTGTTTTKKAHKKHPSTNRNLHNTKSQNLQNRNTDPTESP